jgi:hypothetical protein
MKSSSPRRRSLFRSRWFRLAMVVALLGVGVKSWLWWRDRGGGITETYTPVSDAQRDTSNVLPGNPANPKQQLRDWAKRAMIDIPKNVRDYSAILMKRERSGGTLSPGQAMFVKVRHQPFSVYLYFLTPESRKGEEALYVEGRNDGSLLGHATGLMGNLGTLALSPTGAVAMYGQRHPIMDIGILNLTRRLLEAAEKHLDSPDCHVRYLPQAKINGHPYLCIEAIIPFPTAKRPHGAQVARIFVDRQLDVPIRYEQYDWSGIAGDKPELAEQYTYLDLKVNRGFTDLDFDVKNPNYQFP